jgi:hypothetical protein
MKSLVLAKHKSDFLKAKGFTQTFKSVEPRIYNGFKSEMECWKKPDDNGFHIIGVYILYIHFYEDEPNICYLSYGEDTDQSEIFSERNLISEINKRL